MRRRNFRNSTPKRREDTHPSRPNEIRRTVAGVSREHRWPVYGLLFLITLLGAWFRLVRLGEQSMRGDTIEYWKLLAKGISVAQIYFDKQHGAAAHSLMAFPVAFVRIFLDVFRLPQNFFTVHLPWACWGIVTIPLAFFCGRLAGGWSIGLLLSALLAISPFHIQCSREAYPYVMGLAGAFLGLWAVLKAVELAAHRRSFTLVFYLVLGVSLFLLLYTCTTMWPFAFLVSAISGVCALTFLWRTPRRWLPAIVLAMLLLSLGVPQTLGFVRQMKAGAIKEVQKAIFGSGVKLFDWRGLQLVTNFAWGATPVRATFTALVGVFGLTGTFVRRRSGTPIVVLACLVAGFFLQMAGRYWLGASFAPRYACPVFPLYVLFLAIGLQEAGFFLQTVTTGISRRLHRTQETTSGPLFLQRFWFWVPSVTGLMLLARPAYVATRLTGQPTPYREISKWIDTNLPRGTPVLVDHWMDPWNQFQVHPATNVYLTYTVPNVPVDLYLKFGWRDTARAFLEKYRDAAYLETAKTYWTDPRIGPWQWPREYFAHRVVFRNEAALELASLGLGYRVESWRGLASAYTNQVICELFFNRVENVLSSAKKRGERVLFMYGAHWGYTKTRDFRDWRVMGTKATLDLYNLTDEPVEVFLRISGVAVGGAKKVRMNMGGEAEFGANRQTVWTSSPFVLPPGRISFELSGTEGSKGGPPLFVGDIVLTEVATATAETTAGQIGIGN
ncbi:MAG: hypothetical protein N2255_06745 [Kiritimatiellae bacterium]|nr:hypothetical protein [Kiritimatiellia bacterium]